MGSTHYMDLLMLNSPWNLIIFMAVPVVLAESIAISELYLLWSQPKILPFLQKFKNVCGILAGAAFLGIIIYFIPYVVIPLCIKGEWRTWIDVTAIVSYLAAGVPMVLIALLNLGLLLKKESPRIKSLYHIIFLAAFLVLSHVAMIFGMVDPTIAGWTPDSQTHMHGQLAAPAGQTPPAPSVRNALEHQPAMHDTRNRDMHMPDSDAHETSPKDAEDMNKHIHHKH